MSLKKIKFFKAFTVPELLIISLVSVLIVFIAFIGVQTAKARARDIKRISDLNELKTVLQLYYLNNGFYPTSGIECSLEQPSATKECSIFVNSFYSALKPYTDIIPGDPLYPKEENGKKYSYRYKATYFGDDYKIHADLETKEPYEVYSLGGFKIGIQQDPGGSGSICPPEVITYSPVLAPGSLNTYLLRGQVIQLGCSGENVTQVGFEWRTEPGGEYGEPGNEWIGTIQAEGAETGYFEHLQSGFYIPPESCLEYHYRAKALDPEGEWGYGGEKDFNICVSTPPPSPPPATPPTKG